MAYRQPMLVPFVVALLGAAVQVSARQAEPVFERLTPASVYNRGCYDPCDCLLMTLEDMRGTFTLRLIDQTPLFSTYALENIRWRAYEGGVPAVFITGEGTYRVGGEFAVTQELNLVLSVDGRAPEHFHSGIVAGSADPPRLDITVSIHDMVCFDTVIRVASEPACADFNADGAVTSQDFFDFLAAFFAGEASADFNGDQAIDSQDFFDYLTAFFGGCG